MPLAAAFESWRKGDASSLALSRCIDELHRGAARCLCSVYATGSSAFNVAHAIAADILPRDQEPHEILELLVGLFAEAEEELTTKDGTA